jgi:SAM-dependent methyltransferase
MEAPLAETPTIEYLEFLRDAIFSAGTVDILEVGGGPQTFVHHPNARYTVLEFEEDTLATCNYADRKMIGDAQTFDFGSMKFDIVVFWNVLEHIPDPSLALSNVVATVREGGLVIIRGPSLKALKAIITRLTPHRFHVAFYRHILGHKNAGRAGHAPYVVSHSPKAEAEELDRFLDKAGFEKIFGQQYDGDQVALLKEYSYALFQGYRIASKLAGWLSFGAFGGRKSDFVAIYRKLPVTVAPV